MKIEVIVLQDFAEKDKVGEWLRPYINAMGAEASITVLEERLSIDMLRRELDVYDGLIVVGAAGRPSEVEKIAKALGLGVEVNEEALNHTRAYFMDVVNPPKNLEDMAKMPEFSYPVQNVRGAVDGFVALSLYSDKFIAATPPSFAETIEVFETGIQDFIREKTGRRFSVTFSFQLEGDLPRISHIVEEVGRKYGKSFARLDGRFASNGVPLVCSIYAETPEELSRLHESISEFINELAGREGVKIIGHPESQAGSRDILE